MENQYTHKPYSHKSTTATKKKVDDYMFVPRPPTTPHPRYHMSGVSNSDIKKHNAIIDELLRKRGPRPDIIPSNTPPIPDKSFRVQPSIGNRTNWNVSDYEKDERPPEKRPRYHADNICGSGFDGLATTIEIKLNEGRIEEAIHQLNNCIEQRKITTRDKSHQNVILILDNLLEQVKNYEDPDVLKDVIDHGGFIVRYNEYIGRLAEFVVEQRRNLSFIPQRFSAGKYKKTYRKRKNKKSIKRYTKKRSLKRKYKKI
jgi:hypothetical protein